MAAPSNDLATYEMLLVVLGSVLRSWFPATCTVWVYHPVRKFKDRMSFNITSNTLLIFAYIMVCAKGDSWGWEWEVRLGAGVRVGVFSFGLASLSHLHNNGRRGVPALHAAPPRDFV